MGISKLKTSAIKSVQRGTVTLNASNSATATITDVDITKSVLFVSGTGIISVSSTPVAARSFQIVFNSSTQIQVTAQQGTGTTVTGTAAWQVVEYY